MHCHLIRSTSFPSIPPFVSVRTSWNWPKNLEKMKEKFLKFWTDQRSSWTSWAGFRAKSRPEIGMSSLLAIDILNPWFFETLKKPFSRTFVSLDIEIATQSDSQLFIFESITKFGFQPVVSLSELQTSFSYLLNFRLFTRLPLDVQTLCYNCISTSKFSEFEESC